MGISSREDLEMRTRHRRRLEGYPELPAWICFCCKQEPCGALPMGLALQWARETVYILYTQHVRYPEHIRAGLSPIELWSRQRRDPWAREVSIP